MFQLLMILSLLACVLLVGIVLIQNPKGGGLASNFSASSQLMGVQKTGDFLEKGTWFLAIFLMVMALAINVVVKGGSATSSGPQRENYGERLKGPAPNLSSPAPTTQNPGVNSITPPPPSKNTK